MLQCIAVCCSVLQRVAVYRSPLIAWSIPKATPFAAVYCSVLQYLAVLSNALQCVAVCCSVLQCVAVCCSVLQCVAMCCSVLQCIAVTSFITNSVFFSSLSLFPPPLSFSFSLSLSLSPLFWTKGDIVSFWGPTWWERARDMKERGEMGGGGGAGEKWRKLAGHNLHIPR